MANRDRPRPGLTLDGIVPNSPPTAARTTFTAGAKGFLRSSGEAKPLPVGQHDAVRFTYHSKDGEEKSIRAITVKVTYTLTG